MKKFLTHAIALFALSIITITNGIAQNNPGKKPIYFSFRPGINMPLADYKATAYTKPTMNYQIDVSYGLSEKTSVGIGIMRGGNNVDAQKIADEIVSNSIFNGAQSTVASDPYRFTAPYILYAYTFTNSDSKLKVQAAARLGAVFTTAPASTYEFAVSGIGVLSSVEYSSSNTTSLYYTGSLNLTYPVTSRFNIGLSTELASWKAEYTTTETDLLNFGSQTDISYKQSHSILFTSLGFQWRIN